MNGTNRGIVRGQVRKHSRLKKPVLPMIRVHARNKRSMVLAVLGCLPAVGFANEPISLTIKPLDNAEVHKTKGRVYASGWIVVDACDVIDTLADFNPASSVEKVELDCDLRKKTCAMAIAALNKRGELFVSNRSLGIKSYNDAKEMLILDSREDLPYCQRQEWTLSVSNNGTTIRTFLDTTRGSEMDACPSSIVFEAHLGSVTEAQANSRLVSDDYCSTAAPAGNERH